MAVGGMIPPPTIKSLKGVFKCYSKEDGQRKKIVC